MFLRQMFSVFINTNGKEFLMFQMIHCTYNKLDEDRFSVSHPYGTDNYVFLHFLCPMRMVVNDHSFIAKTNCCILLSPDVPYYYESIDHTELHTSFFHFQASNDFMKRFDFPYNEPVYVPNTKIVDDYMMKLFSYVVEQSPLQTIDETATVELLFSYITKSIHSNANPPLYEQTEMMNQIRLTVFSNVATNWSAQSIAQLSNLSVPQFYKLYKELYHVSPMEDLNRYRIESAKRLLTSGYSVASVASMVGMNSSHYFTDFFKKRVGLTPTQFRKNLFDQISTEEHEPKQ